MDDYYDEDGFAPKTYVPIYDDPWQLRDVLYENVTYDELKRKINDLTLTEIGCPAKRFDDLNWFTEGPTAWSTSIKQRYVNRFKIAALLADKVKKLDALYSFQTEKGEKQILPLNQYGIAILQFYTDNFIDNYETFNKFIENFFGDALLPSYMKQINFTNMNDDILDKIQLEITNIHYLGKNGEVPPVETIQLEQPKQQESVKPYEEEIKEADKDVYVPDEVILEDEEQYRTEYNVIGQIIDSDYKTLLTDDEKRQWLEQKSKDYALCMKELNKPELKKLYEISRNDNEIYDDNTIIELMKRFKNNIRRIKAHLAWEAVLFEYRKEFLEKYPTVFSDEEAAETVEDEVAKIKKKIKKHKSFDSNEQLKIIMTK